MPLTLDPIVTPTPHVADSDNPEVLVRIAEVAHSRVRLERVEDDGCALFHADTRCAIVIDPTQIRSAPAWHVAVFKGRAWPGAEDNALIHRSAPVSHRGEHRLRLCIDLSDACAC